jgi:hypothetical protein
MKITDFFSAQIRKAGLDPVSYKLDTLGDIEVDDNLVNALNIKLMTAEAAKQNSDVRGAIKAETLAGVDAQISKAARELNLPEAAIAEIEGNKNSFEKIGMIAAKVSDQMANTSKKTPSDELVKEVDNLRKQLADKDKEAENKVMQAKTEFENQLVRRDLQAMVSSMPLALPDDMPNDIKMQMALIPIESELKKRGIKTVYKEGKLSIVKEDGTQPYNEDNTPVDLTHLINGTLQSNKLLRVSEPATKQVQQATRTSQGNDKSTPVNLAAADRMEDVVAQMMKK